MRTDHTATLLDRIEDLAETCGDRTAVVGSSESWTYRELLERAHVVASAVSDDKGPLAIVMGNEPSFLAAMFGVWAAGRVALLIDPRTAIAEIRGITATFGPPAMVVGKTTPPGLRTAAGDLARTVMVQGRGFGASETSIAEKIDSESPALVLFTAGSTGPAKAVVHNHARLSMATSTVARHRQTLIRSLTPARAVTMLRRFPTLPMRLIRARRQLVWMTPMPFSSISGVTIAGQALSSAGRLVASWPFSPSSTWGAIRDEHVNVLAVTPTMLAALLDERRPGDEASLLVVGVGSAPLPEGLRTRAETELGCPVIVGYGSTELGGGVLATTPWDRHEVAGDVGFAVTGTEWKIVDAAGQPVPPGVIGELAHRSPGLMVGYAGSDHKARIDADGWYLTGDLAVAGPDGRVRVTGRRDKRIERKGNKLYPVEIEQVLESHPEVAKCAVVGKRAPDGEMRIEAFIVPVEGSFLTTGSLRTWCTGRLSRYKLPDRYMLVSSLPQTDAGEPRRADLVRDAPGLDTIVLDAPRGSLHD